MALTKRMKIIIPVSVVIYFLVMFSVPYFIMHESLQDSALFSGTATLIFAVLFTALMHYAGKRTSRPPED